MSKRTMNCTDYLSWYKQLHSNNKYAPQMSHVCQLLHLQIWDNYVSLSTLYELNAINNVTMTTGMHTFNTACIYINQTTAKYVPGTNMPQLHIYVTCINYLMHIYEGGIQICMSHKKSLQAKLWSVGSATLTDRWMVYDCISWPTHSG